MRFGIWTLVLLVYYIFVALHASYDAAKETESTANAETNMEAGSVELAKPL